MYKYITLSLFIIFYSLSFAQKTVMKPLSPGLKVPNIALGVFMNEPKKNLKISELKGKLVVLDFWNIWCSSCILAMPKMDSLQKRFNNSIQIILITNNTEPEIAKLFSKVKIKRPNLPMIINDHIFQQLFPHNSVPHHVWIDDNGIVKYITDGYNTNIKNIQAVLNGQELNLHYKNELQSFEKDESLLLNGNRSLANHLKYYSFIMNRIDEYGGSYLKVPAIDSSKKIITTRITNSSVLELYKLAFGYLIPGGVTDIYSKELLNNRVLLEVENSVNFCEPKDDSKKDEWYSNNLFSYEAVSPLSGLDEAYSFMQHNLNYYFPYEGKIEKRKIKCLVLKRISKMDKLQSKGGSTWNIADNNYVSIQNSPINAFVNILANVYENLKTPLIDGTNYTDNIDIFLKAELNNIYDLKKALMLFDLDLIEEEREIKMLVITDKNFKVKLNCTNKK